MSGTHLYYNGVLFRDCETLEYSCVLDFDESGTHEKYMRTKITVASTLVSLYVSGSSDPLGVSAQHPSTIRIPPVLAAPGGTVGADETTPARIEEIKERLSEPRKDFWYAVNGVRTPSGVATTTPQEDRGEDSTYRLILVATGLYPRAATSGSDPLEVTDYVKFFDTDLTVKRANVLDANNGPKPSGLSVAKIQGGNVMRIQATFEVCRVLSKPVTDENNPDPGYDAQKVRGVVCNSWGVTDSLDDDGAVTHTVNGKMVVKDKRYKANAMRMVAFPLAFPYARLVSRQYTVDHSGLVLEYQFQFRHAGAAPPQGIRKYEASYSEMVGPPGAAGVYRAQMSIKVMGWHDRSDESTALLERERKQKLLLYRGSQSILNARITGLAKIWEPLPGQNAKTAFITDYKVIERVGHPELEVQVVVNYGESNNTEFLSRVANMGKPIPIPDYDPRWWPMDSEWGRLPSGNGAAGNNGDSDNPNFDNAAYPYAGEGDPTKSDYFTGYFQPPGNNRHSLPRITTVTLASTDASKEWARPGGFVPSDATTDASVGMEQNLNPIDTPNFTAIVSKDLAGSVVLGPLEPVTNSSYTGIADVQGTGFMYVAYRSEVMNDTAQGQLSLPLSVPRDIPLAKRLALFAAGGFVDVGLGTSTTGKECSVALTLCAPETLRVYSVSTTRSQKWGELPEPIPLIVRTSGSGSTRQIVQVETLVRKEFLPETPTLRQDGITREFTHHARYTYALSNPWRGTAGEGSIGDFEEIPVGFSPVCKATAAQNAIVVKGDVGTLSPLFTSPQYG
jgi:hypothetical protein